MHTSVVRRAMSDQEKDDHEKSTKLEDDTTNTTNSKMAGNSKISGKSFPPPDSGNLEKQSNKKEDKHKKEEDKQQKSLPVLSKEPQYVLKYRYDQSDVPTIRGDSDPCRPTSILVEVSLPEMSSAKGIELDVLEHLLTLESKVVIF